MDNLFLLLKGDLQRGRRYKIFMASLLVAMIWIVVLHFSALDLKILFPLLLFFDLTSMSMLFVGVSLFFERQEEVLKTLLVSPITKEEYILSKLLNTTCSNLVTLFLLVGYGIAFKGLEIGIVGIMGTVVVTSLVHALFGFIAAYGARDFTGMLMKVMAYSFLMVVPVTLETIGLIQNQVLKNLIVLLPTKSVLTLMNASLVPYESWQVLFSVGYLLVFLGVGFFFVRRGFSHFAERGV